ncbi:MAG TPA: SMC-Scp complex subunit ScpB [Nitrospiraceae bacterium]|nr:SMC-Scp complex subunit ScpB [Nitrospiraceae bacterium]
MSTPIDRPKDDDVPLHDCGETVLTKSETNGHGAGNGNGNGADHQEVLWETLDERAVKGILEALLFVCDEPLSVDRLVAVLGKMSKAEVIEALRRLQEDFSQEGRGLQLVELAGGFRIVTRPDVAYWVKRLDKVKSAPKLSRSALESLAIIAYKQPIVRAEIEEIRGVETSSVLRTLLERKLVRMMGRKDVPGRPILYGTTKYFLEHFGLRDLSELPPLREFKELGESEQASLPVGDDSLFLIPEPVERA